MPPEMTLASALGRVYQIRAQNRSFSVTMPGALAKPFIEKFGPNIIYEVREDGILLKPVPTEAPADLPAWLSSNGPKPKQPRKRG